MKSNEEAGYPAILVFRGEGLTLKKRTTMYNLDLEGLLELRQVVEPRLAELAESSKQLEAGETEYEMYMTTLEYLNDLNNRIAALRRNYNVNYNDPRPLSVEKLRDKILTFLFG
jgi:hypothetical protein